MTAEPSRPDIPAEPREAAAWWFARVHSGALSRRDREALARWRQAAPENEREFQAAEALGNAAAALPRERVRALLGGDIPVRPALRRRQVLRTGLGLACAVAAVAGIGLYRPPAPARYTARLATRKGERRQEALPDGSVVELNTDTEATIALYDESRVVELLHGEIMFTVSPDAARPFIVEAGPGRIRVVGTRFDVRREGGHVAVAVESGTVEVSSGPWWRRTTQVLTAGLGTGLDADGAQSAMHDIDVSALTAWRSGRIVFDGVPLADMVQEVNRYLGHPLRVADPRLNALRVSASFLLDTPDTLIQSLPKILPVEIRPQADGSLLLTAR